MMIFSTRLGALTAEAFRELVRVLLIAMFVIPEGPAEDPQKAEVIPTAATFGPNSKAIRAAVDMTTTGSLTARIGFMDSYSFAEYAKRNRAAFVSLVVHGLGVAEAEAEATIDEITIDVLERIAAGPGEGTSAGPNGHSWAV